MQELEGYLEALHLDLRHVSQLFGVEDHLLEDPQQFSWQVEEREGHFCCRMRWGAQVREETVPVPEALQDVRLHALHRKRAVRRLCRQTLYLLLREVTGIHPPWGAMTGIRPTRLFYESLEAGHSMETAEQDLIDRFDLYPEKAALLRETVSFQKTMLAPDDGSVDLYIGIPFCTTRCAYCSFSSGEIGDGRLVEPYLTALAGEMQKGAEILAASGKRVRAMYMGGGTPTSLRAGQLERVLSLASALFPGCMEMTVEAGRPDTLDVEKLRVIRDCGANRISINPQTMNDETLRRIGRAHTAEDVVRAYAMARDVGFHHINMDVIAGLPGEDADAFAGTLQWARKLSPESLTVHTLAIKRTSRLQQSGTRMHNAGEVASMVRDGYCCAREMGLAPYYLYRQKQMTGNLENVGYALPGHGCQYNVDMMEETTHILAFGAGAISKRVYPEEGHIERAPNVGNIEAYIARWQEMAERKAALFAPGLAKPQEPCYNAACSGDTPAKEETDSGYKTEV